MSGHEKEHSPPDFAMLRAVEIMAQFVERQMPKQIVPPAPIDRPVVLFNENLPLAIGQTSRTDVERAFGTGFTFPAQGWHSYALRHEGAPALLSLFYKDDVLIGAECYLSKTKAAPALAPRNIGEFRLVPGEIGLGTSFTRLSPEYTPAVGGPSPLIFAHASEVRFPGGVAYVMGNKGRVERLVLYVAS